MFGFGKNKNKEVNEVVDEEVVDSTETISEEAIEETQETVEEVEAVTEDKPKKGFFKRLVAGLSKTRNSIKSGFDSVFGLSHIDDDFYEELEEILIMADIGVVTTENIIDDLKEKVKELKIKEPAQCRELLIDTIKAQMSVDEDAYDFEDKKSVILMIGVNGVGKTTTTGKLAAQYKNNGKKVLLAAADTFRAAAIEQLTEWSNRSGW